MLCLPVYHRSRSDIDRLIKDNRLWGMIYWTVVVGIILQGGSNFVVLHILHIQPPDISFAYRIVAAPIISVIFSSINEELIYRKIIFGYMNRKFGFLSGAIISSILFALSHANYAGYLGYFAVAMVWCFSYRKSKTIAVPIISHVIINLSSFITYTIQHT